MHRTKSPLSALVPMGLALSSLLACTDSATHAPVSHSQGLLCSVRTEGSGARGGCVTFTATEEGAYALSGRLEQGDAQSLTHPLDLTLLRYGAKGEHMVVTDYLNLALGEEDNFRIDGLPEGLWVVSARGASMGGAAWGRSEPILLGPDAAAADVLVELRSYGANVEIVGVPAALMGEVGLTFEWTSTDRVQGDGLEFLDPPVRPGHGGAQRDGFQVFGSLVQVPQVWLAYDQDALPGQGPEGEPMLDVQSDPFGLGKTIWSWVSPCQLGNAILSMAGPGRVSATLHSASGLWPSQVVTFDLTEDSPFARDVLTVEVEDGGSAASQRVVRCPGPSEKQ